MTLSLQQALIFKEDVLVQNVGTEKVLLSLSREEYFGLNDISATMWDTLKASPSLQTGYEQLLAIFEVDPSQLEQDLLALVEQWIEHGLVEVV